VTVDWAHVYRTTFEDLVRFLYRKVWDADRAHDLAQEAFVRGLNETPDHPRAWLFTVAGNLARDEARAAERRKRHLVLIKTEAELRPVPNPDRSEQVRAVRRALESLTERDRDVLLLWDAGLNYEEIAAETGLAGSAIGTTLARARKRLVAAYEAQEERHAAHQ